MDKPQKSLNPKSANQQLNGHDIKLKEFSASSTTSSSGEPEEDSFYISSEEEVDLIDEIYKIRYPVEVKAFSLSDIVINLPKVEDFTPEAAAVFKKQLEEYQKQLSEKIGDYLPPDVRSEIRKHQLENAKAWFDEAFRLDNKSSDKYDASDIKTVKMRKWFLINCQTKNFDRTVGYCIGKNATHVDVVTTKWLQKQNLYKCSIDGTRSIKYKVQYPNIDKIKSNKLEDYLKPLTKEAILVLFETENFESLELEIVKYIHCNARDIYRGDTDEIIDEEDFHFKGMDY